MDIKILTFSELSTNQLYDILKLRQAVFIEEQKSIYSDIDGFDQSASHLCVYLNDTLAAYTRLREVNEGQTLKIERVVTAKAFRRRKLASIIMDIIMDKVVNADTHLQLFLSAQTDVIDFYRKWGFESEGEPYDDGGILHKDMWRIIN